MGSSLKFFKLSHLAKLIVMFFILFNPVTLSAATYYVSTSGSDANKGTSKEAPWKTVSSSMWRLKDGDSILLKRGDVFYETASVMIVTNNVSFGAYGSGDRPIIHGNGFTEPGGAYDALLVVGNGDGTKGHHASVQDIELKQSSGMGLVVHADNAVVRNVFVNQSTTSGITIHVMASGALVEDSEVYNHNHAWGPESRYEALGLNKGTWGIGIASKGSNFIIRNNFVHRGWGEGIGANCGGVDGVIEGNRIESNKIGVYLDIAQNIVVRANEIKGASEKSFWRSTSTIGQGIGVNHETWCASQAASKGRSPTNDNLVIEGNKVSNTSTGFFVWSQDDASVQSNITLTCNSFTDNLYQVEGSNVAVKNLLVENNIFAAINSPEYIPVKSFSLSGSFKFNENAWYPEPTLDVVKSAFDTYSATASAYSACTGSENVEISPPLPPSDVVVESSVH